MLTAVHLGIAALSAAMVSRLLPRARTHFLMICLLLSLGLLHGLIPAITPLSMWSLEASEASRLSAAWYSFFGVLSLASGYSVFMAVTPSRSRGDGLDQFRATQHQAFLKICFWVSIVLGLLGATLYIKSTGASLLDYASASRFEFRHFRNRPLMWSGHYLFHLSFAPGFLGQFMSRRYRVIGTCFAAFMAAVAFFYLFKGTRHVALGVASAVMVGYVYRHRLTPKRLACIGAAGAAMIFSVVALYEVRKELNSSSVWQTLSRAFSVESLGEPLTRDPLNYHQHFVGAVEYFPAEHPFLNGASYRRMLTFYLPGDFNPVLKPEDPTRVFASIVYGHIYKDEFRATHPPSLFGDAYINFWGWPGLIVVAFNGAALGWITRRVQESELWFVAIGPHLGWFVLLAPRGNLYIFFLMALFLLGVGRLLLAMKPTNSRQRRRLPSYLSRPLPQS